VCSGNTHSTTGVGSQCIDRVWDGAEGSDITIVLFCRWFGSGSPGFFDMSSECVTDHFWVSGPSFFSSTLLVASGASISDGGRVATSCALYDVDGVRVNSFEFEFPENEVGVLELEPFMAGLKMQGGIPQGHLEVRSPVGCRHFCRQQMGGHVDLLSSPRLIRGRESSFVPLILGARRSHVALFVNAADEVAQVVVRLFYGSRSPEWSLSVPAKGCLAVALEEELLSTFNDSSWTKGAVQGYLRISPRSQAQIACQVIEQIPGETEEQEQFRCLVSW